MRFGYSGMPPAGIPDERFLDDLAERGHKAFELAFVKGFPWRERRCARFAAAAADRGIRLTAHAPYFATLTVADPDRAKRRRSAVEHTIKLGAELGAPLIVAHLGALRDETPGRVFPRVREHLEWIGSKTSLLGVGLGLETAGKTGQLGSLGDIALLASEFPFVRPVPDWAHLHAITGGGLDSQEAFAAVLGFMKDNFPAWMLDPLHTHFSDVLYGEAGEIRHLPYGEGTLRVAPLIRAVREAGLRTTVISESRDGPSHDAIHRETLQTLAEPIPEPSGFPIASGLADFPTVPRARPAARGYETPGPRPVRLTNLDKKFFPDGYTKGDLISYYASVAPVLVPHLAGRAIVMARFPDGCEGASFYEKQAPGHQPEWMPLAPLRSAHRGGVIEYVTAGNAESLLWLANMGCIEIHPWLSRADEDKVGFPDFAVFDLDPSQGATWERVTETAGLLKVALDQLGLRGFPKTSGSRGLHVYVPLQPVHEYDRVRRFVERLGGALAAAAPETITMERRIPHRAGRVFIDSGQNRGGATIASVYSVRPRPGAPVSVPFHWEELEDIRPDDFTIATVWERISRWGDLFAPVLEGGQTLDAAESKLGITD